MIKESFGYVTKLQNQFFDTNKKNTEMTHAIIIEDRQRDQKREDRYEEKTEALTVKGNAYISGGKVFNNSSKN